LTECSEQLHFNFYHHKELVADFKGGAVVLSEIGPADSSGAWRGKGGRQVT